MQLSCPWSNPCPHGFGSSTKLSEQVGRWEGSFQLIIATNILLSRTACSWDGVDCWQYIILPTACSRDAMDSWQYITMPTASSRDAMDCWQYIMLPTACSRNAMDYWQYIMLPTACSRDAVDCWQFIMLPTACSRDAVDCWQYIMLPTACSRDAMDYWQYIMLPTACSRDAMDCWQYIIYATSSQAWYHSEVQVLILTGGFGSYIPIFVVFVPIWPNCLWQNRNIIFWFVLSLKSLIAVISQSLYPWLWLFPTEAEVLHTWCPGYGSQC